MLRKSVFVENRSSEATAKFKILTEKYCAIASSAGVRCLPYRDPALPIFLAVAPEVQNRAIAFLENALAVFDEAIAQGESVRDSRCQVWRLLNRLKFVPTSDIFEKIGEDDVVEIFSVSEESHVAWNLRLMDFVSYTIEQLLCIPWWELAERPPEIMRAIQETVGKIVSNEVTETLISPFPIHIFAEIGSEERFKIEVEIKYVSPLRQAGRNVGFLSVTRGRAL
jgi:hypothetical protein